MSFVEVLRTLRIKLYYLPVLDITYIAFITVVARIRTERLDLL
jgi:hypothetical protein